MLIKTDSYKTIKKNAEGFFKVKGSKFIALAYPVSNENEIKDILKTIKKEYYDARHHCYAYKLGLGEGDYRMNDDGEPSGTAGKPIFRQILSHGLSDILLIVIRYFGGTLLGTSGLINAYKYASKDVIRNAEIINKTVKKQLKVEFSYDHLNKVMRLVKDEGIEILSQDFAESCSLLLNIRASKYIEIKGKFESIYGIDTV